MAVFDQATFNLSEQRPELVGGLGNGGLCDEFVARFKTDHWKKHHRSIAGMSLLTAYSLPSGIPVCMNWTLHSTTMLLSQNLRRHLKVVRMLVMRSTFR